jgi:hypothetical protein
VTGVQDHETVSIYPFDQKQIDTLLTQARECTLNWTTKDGWPVGVIHSFVWRQGRVWITAGGHRHRISALRRDPRCSVVVSAAAAPESGIAGAITIKGRCIVHEDQQTKDWFYEALARKSNPTNEAGAKAFEQRLDSPLRVILEVVPAKWITFDAAKFAADTAGTLRDDQKGPPLSSDSERLPRELRKRGISQ